MPAQRLSLVAVTAVALAVASPASALSGYPLSHVLHVSNLTVLKSKTQKAGHTCQAGRSQTRGGTDPRNPPVVACEQPPRSQLGGPSLSKSLTSALAAFG
jgi:hypothetical protein